MKPVFRAALMSACAWLSFAFFLALVQPASAQISDAVTYTAYLGAEDIDKTNALWDKAVAEKQAAFDKNSKDATLRWNLALSQYGLLGGTMRNKNEDRFDKYYKTTEAHLESLGKEEKFKAEAKALLSGLYGMKMAYNSMMGMVLGPKSGGLSEAAIELAPTSPIAWKIQANSKYFTPSMFGGDVNEAIKAYEKSIELFEKDQSALTNNWLYLDTIIFLGQAYSSESQWAKAVAVYEKALKFEPNANWVKFQLLPKAKQKALGN